MRLSMFSKKMWVCGKISNKNDLAGVIWKFCGVFDKRLRAIWTCKTRYYFIFPSRLNQPIEYECAIKDYPEILFPLDVPDIPQIDINETKTTKSIMENNIWVSAKQTVS